MKWHDVCESGFSVHSIIQIVLVLFLRGVNRALAAGSSLYYPQKWKGLKRLDSKKRAKEGQKHASSSSLSLTWYWEASTPLWEWPRSSGPSLGTGYVSDSDPPITLWRGQPQEGPAVVFEEKNSFSWADDKWHFSEIRTSGFLWLPAQGLKVLGDLPSFHTLALLNLGKRLGLRYISFSVSYYFLQIFHA